MSEHVARGRSRWGRLLTLLALLVTATLLGAATLRPRLPPRAAPNEGDQRADKHPVTIRSPSGPPLVPTGLIDAHGRPVSVACNTCHQGRPANPEARLGRDLSAFHQKLDGKHGDLTCTSCHDPADGYQSLRLANGKTLPHAEVMRPCAQCHGPQYRDYLHGAHGGMTGYWDLSRGPRTRNNCVHCHQPHAPHYPMVRPARGPGDVSETKRSSHE